MNTSTRRTESLHRQWSIGTAVAAVALYGVLWAGVAQDWRWLSRIDDAALSAAYSLAADRPGWVTGWAVFCTVLSPMAFRLAALIVATVAFLRGQRAVAVFLVVAVVLNGVLIEAAKFAAGRSRPDGALVTAHSTSFPSGHAVGVLLGVLALLTVAWPLLTEARRLGWVIAGAVVVSTIGAGRVVLNVHHPSDVLAGWALGYAFFVLCLLVIPPRRMVRAGPVTEEDQTPATPDSAP